MTSAAAPAPVSSPRYASRRASTSAGYAYRMLGSSFEADDAVQETMLRAWRNIGQFEGRSSLRSWLYRIATNVCLDMLGSRQRRARPMDLAPAGSAEGPLGDQLPEVAWPLKRAVSRMPAIPKTLEGSSLAVRYAQ